MDNSKYIYYKKILDDLKSISSEKKSQSKTFMEVGGYPHFENVASNIIAFFFTSDEEHRFTDMFFKSLLEIAGEDVSLQTHNVSAEREYPTHKNNRIDIVLSNDDFVVGIENKIYSGVQNDLKDYRDTINKLANFEKKKALHVILSLKDEKSIGISNGFVNITYDMLFDSIKGKLGQYIQSADNTWLLNLKDFIKTIDGLKRGGAPMNIDLLKFINDNNQMVHKLLTESYWLKRDLSQQTKKLKGVVDLENYKIDMIFNDYCHNPKVDIFSSYVIDIDKTEGKILVVETYVNASGWHIAIWNRFGKDRGKKELEAKLSAMGISFHNYDFEIKSESNFIVVKDYNHDADFSIIVNDIYEAMNTAKIINL